MKKRADGVQIHSDEPMYELIPYIMEKRYDAMNMVTLDIPMEPMEAYIKEKRREGRPISHMALLICAYLRTAAEYPELNRFIINRRIYARNEFSVAMVVLKPGEDQGTMNKMYLEMQDDIFEVQRKIDDYVSTNRQAGEQNSTDELMRKLLRHPILLGTLVRLLIWGDKHNLLPKSIIDASPFHASLLVTNLASIRTNHIYHHLYEFGSSSMFMAMGNRREVVKKTKDGVEFVRCMPVGCVMDERICSGSYFALCFARMREYLNDPRLMEEPPRVVKQDPFVTNPAK